MEDICTRLGAARPLETEARDGSHRRLCGGQDLLKPLLAKHRTGQIRSQHLMPIIPEKSARHHSAGQSRNIVEAQS
jgi:hypothetical protein